MNTNSDERTKMVFRVRGLPNNVKTFGDVASLLGSVFSELEGDTIRVYSLATALDFTHNFRESPCYKVATVMFPCLPVLIQNSVGKQEWSARIATPNLQGFGNIILDIHFMGMTPLNDPGINHSFEYTKL
jgi:hypothetical protein